MRRNSLRFLGGLWRQTSAGPCWNHRFAVLASFAVGTSVAACYVSSEPETEEATSGQERDNQGTQGAGGANASSGQGRIPVVTGMNESTPVTIEFLTDSLVHVEFGKTGTSSGTSMDPRQGTAIYHSPMVQDRAWSGPNFFRTLGDGTHETDRVQVRVEASGCVAIRDKVRAVALTKVCPQDMVNPVKTLSIDSPGFSNVYGLGQEFRKLGSPDGDWVFHGRRESDHPGQRQDQGNSFMPFGPTGMVGNVQIPVLYAMSAQTNYALFLDNVYKQNWEFPRDKPWNARMWGDQIRFYVMAGDDLPSLRRQYMQIVGTPPVPPRKAFGLWVSEFGYRNWESIDRLKDHLRSNGFPLDGFVLDLFWFGGVKPNSSDSRMGTLSWDDRNDDGNGYYFPDPARKIRQYKDERIGLVAIEESYIAKNSDTYRQMTSAGPLLAWNEPSGQCNPLDPKRGPVTLSGWFGESGMVDWSNPAAGTWVHDNRRLPNLIRLGITSHWTDLGEPEAYDPWACYTGVEPNGSSKKNRHGDIHNLYAFLWNKSIYDGYVRHNQEVPARPFIVTRSGAAGSQRFGTAMWSGDIGADYGLLASHLNAQMHMSFSGIDYYGSDIGGFRRENLNPADEDGLYTNWFAHGSWFDVPVRPHTDNGFQETHYRTAPSLLGDVNSNRANLRQRYELIPYYYSLAHKAFDTGEALMPPMVYFYQKDPNVHGIGAQKFLGRDLLVATAAEKGLSTKDVYLPADEWFDYYDKTFIPSSGQWRRAVPLYRQGVFRLPAFVRAGSIIPKMWVDDATLDAHGARKDGSLQSPLVVDVYGGREGAFALVEDDGETVRFDPDGRPTYRRAMTNIRQTLDATSATVTFGAREGDDESLPAVNEVSLNYYERDAKPVKAVVVNGAPLPAPVACRDLRGDAMQWCQDGRQVTVRIPALRRGVETRVVIKH